MNKAVRYILILMLISSALIFVLYQYANKKADRKNGFDRVFSGNQVLLKASFVLEPDMYTIAEFSQRSVICFKARKPAEVFKLSLDPLKIAESSYIFTSPEVKTEGINTIGFYPEGTIVLNGKSAMAYKLTEKGKNMDSSQIDSLPFHQSIMIDPNAFVLMSRTRLNGQTRRVLKKVEWKRTFQQCFVPEKQVDGYFCTDGQFDYDPESGRLIYMFYYRGTFVCLDSNMRVIYKTSTIDTVNRVKISVKSTKVLLHGDSVDKVVTTAPPMIVNRRVCIADGLVYINSNLKADNEERKGFNDGFVIDVYALENGRYKGSFYLPALGRQKLTQFKVSGNQMIALYNHTLALFELPVFK